MWDISSPTKDRTLAPEVEVWSLNHWITREVPYIYLLKSLESVLCHYFIFNIGKLYLLSFCFFNHFQKPKESIEFNLVQDMIIKYLLW